MTDLFSLAGKTAVVTGGEGLLGNLICRTIVELGGRPVSADIKPSSHYVLDVCKPYSCHRMASIFPQTSILVNAAVGNQKAVPQFDERWGPDLEIGLTGAMNMIRAFAEPLIANQGVILNIGSDLSLIAPDNSLYQDGLVKPASYSAVKHGIVGLTRYFASYFGDKVRVNCLCPGGIDEGQAVPHVPMKRLAHIDEMKGPVAFLLSQASSYVTGSVLVADGGRTCW